ncbi:MAG: acyl-CoA dehydrogenase family protein [Myxococcota bacterium]|nr:acyl-CoA dehydrogenase family protein [Myxococcota bacterium]
MSTSFPPWTEEHEMIRNTVRSFATEKLAPFAAEWDKAQSYPAREVIGEMAQLGLLGIRYPEEYGGMGLDWWSSAAYIESMAYSKSAGLMMSVLVHTDMATPVISEIGTPEQKEEFLAPAISGEKIAALGVTEPGAGSDVASIRTTAKMDGDDFIINGQKTYITNGSFADFIVLAVRTGDDGFGGISLVLFPTDTPGFTVGRKLDKLGTRCVDSSELHFDNCRIPQRNLLGSLNGGFIHIMQNFQGERLAAALMATSGMELQVQESLKYGRERHAFGRPIIGFQVWRHKFAEHLGAIKAAQMLTYHAVDKMNQGVDATLEVSQAKLFAGDLAQKVCYDCLQFHGGYGYIEEYDVCRSYRDVRLMTIGGGTSEVMKEIISKYLGF